MKRAFAFMMTLSLALASSSVFAQDIQTKGSIAGTVTDQGGAVIEGATIKVTGAEGERTTTSDSNGTFLVENLIPGVYSISVSSTNFKTAALTNVPVSVGKRTSLNIKLEPGRFEEVVTVSAAEVIDKASTATSANLSDQLFDNIPVQRQVASLFYLAPGVTDSLGGGTNNPSISGGSALDNLYIADGVNITDSAFGGIGTFSRSYGGLGTGITSAFVKEVQVKTAGFEAQYGQSEGGIVNVITQSGSNTFHGDVFAYGQPEAFEATRKQPDNFNTNKGGKILNQAFYDTGADVGGRIVKDKLFFFGSFNPSVRRDLVIGASRNAADLASGNTAIVDSGLFTLRGEFDRRFTSYNYAGKLDWNVSPDHVVTFSLYGDPTKTNKSSFASLNIDNTTADSVLDYGSRNMAVRYTGSLSTTWTMSASFGWNNNHFDESGFDNFNQILDRTQTLPGQRGNFVAIGRGFFEPTNGDTYRVDWSTQKIKNFGKWFGSHTATIGYQYQRAYYSGTRDRSGPHYVIPAANAAGTPLSDPTIGAGAAVGATMNAQWSLRIAPSTCTLCPLMDIPGRGPQPVYLRQDRGEYGEPVFDTQSNYNAFYGQDSIRFTKRITVNLGLRNEQERIIGNQGLVAYSFTGQWAPRLGATFDPTGSGRTKIFYNFGRFFEYIPLDEGERSLSSELDFIGAAFAPEFTTSGGARRVVLNSFGTVNPVIDSAHLLNRASGGIDAGIAVGTQSTFNPILPGTKLGYADEHTIGIEQQLPANMVLSVRYIDRRLKRITEDAAVIAPEDYQNGLFGQVYFIGNINSKLDVAVNPIPHVFTPTLNASGAITNLPSACSPSLVDYPISDSNGNTLSQAVCYEPKGKNGGFPGDFGADGVPDGFPDPVHKYKALEIEVNKRFSNHWQLMSNWRISRLTGNFEGHFRNDNGQTDPGISSLFDFTAGSVGLLGDQFSPGVLNTDRLHVINVYGSYEFSKDGGFLTRLAGLNIGPRIHFETGVPISQFNAHPAYLNAGEIPVGGRGSLGRTDPYFRFDFHANYPWRINERLKLNFVGDFFNLFNSTIVRLPNQNAQITVGTPNVDFLHPALFYLPFNFRAGMKLQW